MDIEEIVLDSPENQPDIEESLPDIPVEIVQPVADIEETPAPKKAKAKGRPVGARNKQPSKPRAKRVVIQEPVTDDPPQYEPSSPRRNFPIPEFAAGDVAVEMLRLLSNQQRAKQERKRQLYASWFT